MTKRVPEKGHLELKGCINPQNKNSSSGWAGNIETTTAVKMTQQRQDAPLIWKKRLSFDFSL